MINKYFFETFNDQLLRYRRLDGLTLREGLWHGTTPQAKKDILGAMTDNLEADMEWREKIMGLSDVEMENIEEAKRKEEEKRKMGVILYGC